MMIYVGMIGGIVHVDPDGKGVDITMQRFLMTFRCEWVFILVKVTDSTQQRLMLS